MPLLIGSGAASGWDVELETAGQVVSEHDVKVDGTGRVSCRIVCHPDVIFWVTIYGPQNDGGIYAVVLMDGIMFDHLFIPPGVTVCSIKGWQDPKTGQYLKFKWLPKTKIYVKGDIPASTNASMHGTIVVRLHNLNNRLPGPQVDRYVPKPSPTRSKNQPTQTHYAHVDAKSVAQSDTLESRRVHDINILPPPLAQVTFNYLESIRVEPSAPARDLVASTEALSLYKLPEGTAKTSSSIKVCS